MTEAEELGIEVQKVIDAQADTPEISPDWIATATMSAIAFTREIHRLGYVGCHLQLRQMARSKLRRQFDPTPEDHDAADAQPDFFPDTLQDRYPRARKPDEQPRYVIRQLMSRDDVDFNVARMRKFGSALLRHADALEEWGKSHLPPEETANLPPEETASS